MILKENPRNSALASFHDSVVLAYLSLFPLCRKVALPWSSSSSDGDRWAAIGITNDSHVTERKRVLLPSSATNFATVQVYSRSASLHLKLQERKKEPELTQCYFLLI